MQKGGGTGSNDRVCYPKICKSDDELCLSSSDSEGEVRKREDKGSCRLPCLLPPPVKNRIRALDWHFYSSTRSYDLKKTHSSGYSTLDDLLPQSTTLQSMMNIKLSQETFFPCQENGGPSRRFQYPATELRND